MGQASVVIILLVGVVVGFLAGAVRANVRHAVRDLRHTRSRLHGLRQDARKATTSALAWGTVLIAVVVLFAVVHGADQAVPSPGHGCPSPTVTSRHAPDRGVADSTCAPAR